MKIESIVIVASESVSFQCSGVKYKVRNDIADRSGSKAFTATIFQTSVAKMHNSENKNVFC